MLSDIMFLKVVKYMNATLYINKSNVIYNLKNIQKKLDGKSKIIAIVKANAYGASIVEFSHLLQDNGINDFGVALLKEGVILRKSGITGMILVTSQFLEDEIKDILDNDLSVSLSNLNIAYTLNNIAKSYNKKVKVHIKIDTGMGRLGFLSSEVVEAINTINRKLKNIIIEGIYTHLSCADTDDNYTKLQLSIFNNVISNLIKTMSFKYIHVLNSAGILKYSCPHCTHVRCGILLYGYFPDKSLKGLIDLKPSFTLKAPIIRIHNTASLEKISYGATYIVPSNSTIATIQIGYADGFPRNLSNNYYVKIGNNKCKVIGNICMDMCMIDITEVKEKINIGDEVTIFENEEDISNISSICNTINYEVISRISTRVERKYIN